MTTARKLKENHADAAVKGAKAHMARTGDLQAPPNQAANAASVAGANIKKKVSRTLVKRTRRESVWVNIGVMVFISLCLLALGWEVIMHIV